MSGLTLVTWLAAAILGLGSVVIFALIVASIFRNNNTGEEG